MGDPASLAYEVTPHEKEIRANVIIVLMESMGSEFFSEFRDDGKKADSGAGKAGFRVALFQPCLFDGNPYRPGHRSAHAGAPPLPGMPIVRLQGNDNLRGIWSVFRERGRATKSGVSTAATAISTT